MEHSVDFILIVGLPGSGKTTLAKKLLGELPNSILFDDLSIDLENSIDRYYSGKFDTVIITDPKMCGVLQSQIEKVVKTNFDADEYNFQYYYFENDPEACIVNAQRDPKPGGTLHFIRCYTYKYFIPEGVTVLPVYKES